MGQTLTGEKLDLVMRELADKDETTIVVPTDTMRMLVADLIELRASVGTSAGKREGLQKAALLVRAAAGAPGTSTETRHALAGVAHTLAACARQEGGR